MTEETQQENVNENLLKTPTDNPEKSEMKISELKKELADIKKAEIFRGSLKMEDLSEHDKQRNVERIIKKWLNLQKIIKEEITLEDVIIKQQEIDTEKLKNYFEEYYGNKLKTRKNWEEVNAIKVENQEKVVPSYVTEKEVQQKLRDACEPIKNLLFMMRDNYDYSTRLLSLIKKNPSLILYMKYQIWICNSVVQIIYTIFVYL